MTRLSPAFGTSCSAALALLATTCAVEAAGGCDLTKAEAAAILGQAVRDGVEAIGTCQYMAVTMADPNTLVAVQVSRRRSCGGGRRTRGGAATWVKAPRVGSVWKIFRIWPMPLMRAQLCAIGNFASTCPMLLSAFSAAACGVIPSLMTSAAAVPQICWAFASEYPGL
jgi:hypothetical protein